MRLRTIIIGTAIAGLTSTSLVASSAFATDPTGAPTVASAAPPADLAAHGPFVSKLNGPLHARSDGISFKTKKDATVRNFFLTYQPHSDSGWHTHPGLVIATVISGEVVRHVKCKEQTFKVGDAFVESGPHLVANTTDAPATLVITQIVRADSVAPYRDSVPEPACPPRHHT